jgi:hypothetical protein
VRTASVFIQPCFERNPMNKGTLTFFNNQKGFGFLQPEDGGNVLLTLRAEPNRCT